MAAHCVHLQDGAVKEPTASRRVSVAAGGHIPGFVSHLLRKAHWFQFLNFIEAVA